MKVAQISESEMSVKGHGVHTAYLEIANALRRRADISLTVNKSSHADIVHIHTVGPFSLWYLLVARGRKVVSAHIVPASLVGSLVGARYWLWFARIYLQWFYNRADLVLAVSDATRDELLALGVKKPIEIFYNIIDTSHYHRHDADRAQARQALAIDRDAWVVVSSGQVQPRKRIDLFVAMANACPDMQFIWVGGVPFKGAAADYGRMKQLMDAPPSNMRFTGVIPLEKVREYYMAADAFVLPSDQETFGMVVVEAAASGLPVVLRDIHDYDQTFRPDALFASEGQFVPILRRLRDDPKFYANSIANAASIASRYDSSAGAARLVALYEDLIR